jgi:hypothetical protein
MPAPDFGPLVTELDVDQAVIATLRKWLPTYLNRIEDWRGLARGTLMRPNAESFENVLEDDTFPEGRLPAVTVTTAQADEFKVIGGMSMLSARWRVVVSVVVRGRTMTEARAVASVFAGATRLLLLQNPDLGGIANGVEPTRAGAAPVDDVSGQDRYLAAGISWFDVWTHDVMDRDAGPLVVDPYPPVDPDQPDDPAGDELEIVGVASDVVLPGTVLPAPTPDDFWVPVWDDDFSVAREYVNWDEQPLSLPVANGKLTLAPNGATAGMHPVGVDVGPDFRATMRFAKPAGAIDHYIGWQARYAAPDMSDGVLYPDLWFVPGSPPTAEVWYWTAASDWVNPGWRQGPMIDDYVGDLWVRVTAIKNRQMALLYTSDPAEPGAVPVMAAQCLLPPAAVSSQRGLYADWFAYDTELVIDRYTIEVPAS